MLVKKILHAAMDAVCVRSTKYDSRGERSMDKIVRVFNELTGHKLSEHDGWQFMQVLKQVRQQQGDYCEDSYVDLAGYAALAAECRKNHQEAKEEKAPVPFETSVKDLKLSPSEANPVRATCRTCKHFTMIGQFTCMDCHHFSKWEPV